MSSPFPPPPTGTTQTQSFPRLLAPEPQVSSASRACSGGKRGGPSCTPSPLDLEDKSGGSEELEEGAWWSLAGGALSPAQPSSTSYSSHPGTVKAAPQARGGVSKSIASLLRGQEDRSQAASLPREESRGPQPSRAYQKRPVYVCSPGLSGTVVGTAGRTQEGRNPSTPSLGRSRLRPRLKPAPFGLSGALRSLDCL